MASNHEALVAMPGTAAGYMQSKNRMSNQGAVTKNSAQYPSLLGQKNASSPLRFNAVATAGKKLSEKTSWTNGLPGRGARSTKSSPALPLYNRSMLHSDKVLSSSTRHPSAGSIADTCNQTNQTARCAFTRLAYSEARRVHHQRDTFKERRARRERQYRDEHVPKATLFQLQQCRTTLKEAFQSVFLGVRSALMKLRAAGKYPRQISSSRKTQNKFFSAYWELLRKHRAASGLAEIRWQQLWQSVQTPHHRKLMLPADQGE